MRKQTLYSIAPHTPFLENLADNILDGSILSGWDLSKPFALSDIVILLPTKRARLSLASIFAQKLGGGAMLPNITTFGDLTPQEAVFLPPYDEKPLPKAISNIKRDLILAKLVQSWATNNPEQTPLQTAEIIALASSLALLIDDLHIENVSHEKLRNITPDNLAENWQQTLDFLLIALQAWPEILAQEKKIDASLLKKIQIEHQAKSAEQIFTDRPVIAAGSTGSVLATANLLKAISKLKRGVIVLPGLNTSLTKTVFASLADIKSNPHGHSQYSLAKLLNHLGAKPEEVVELANKENIRTNIIRHSLALSADTANWANEKQQFKNEISLAFEKVSLISATTDQEQARAIALACLNGLNKKQSIGIISPDRNFARRIASELARFDIKVDDSAGTPLFYTRAGRLIRQILALAKNKFFSVDLIAFLRNQQTCLGLNRADIAKSTDLLEYGLLRSQRLNSGIEGLRLALNNNLNSKNKYVPLRLDKNQGEKISDLLDRLEKIFMPLTSLFEDKDFSIFKFADILAELIFAIIKTDQDGVDINIKDDMKLALDWLADLKNEQGENINIKLNSSDIEASLKGLMGGLSYRASASYDSDIAIWGLLEARLQNPDLMILAGLNETIWPKIADPGPWLSRNMAIEAGLEPPEKRIGQAAHDFEMAMGNKHVIIAHSKNIGTSTAQASRLLQRLNAFIGEEEMLKCKQRGDIWLEQAQAIDFCANPKPAIRPVPNPKQSLRPKSLSVTEIETLVRSPYDIYAKYVLKLKPLDAIGQEPDARDKGNIIHAIFEQFIKEKIDVKAPDALANLMNIAKEHFSILSSNSSLETLWLSRFNIIAKEFIKFECVRDANILARYAEIYGEWELPATDPIFILRGKADRIDITNDNNIEILDYKTGAVPDVKDMKQFLAPQMLLEAAMAREGVFANIEPKSISALKYIKFAFGPDAFKITDFAIEKEIDLEKAIDEIVKRLSMQVRHYLLSDDKPMSARIFPSATQKFIGNYDHLARTGEWSSIDILEDE